MPDQLNITIIDNNGETGSTGFSIPTVSDVNYAIIDADVSDLINAINGLIIGNRKSSYLKVENFDGGNARPANTWAQVEVVWEVRYTGANGKTYLRTIPTANLALLTSGSEQLDLSGTEAAAFVAAFEGVVVDEDGGAVTVDSIRAAGRNR